MKTLVSYVSGCAGDFVVNCFNQTFGSLNNTGTVQPSASIKQYDMTLSQSDLMDMINRMDQTYIGSHAVDRLIGLPVRKVIWLVISDRQQFEIWVRRDAVTRSVDLMMSRWGNSYDIIRHLVAQKKMHQAVAAYLNHLEKHNWMQNQLRLAQTKNVIDVAELLTPTGYKILCDQTVEPVTYPQAVQNYHRSWLDAQMPLADHDWVYQNLSEKLCVFFDHDRQSASKVL